MSFKNPTKIDVFKHFGLACLFLILIIILVFHVYFPIITNHGESLTVPELKGIQFDELAEYLEERDLRYEVEPDSSYSAKYPPLAVLKQFPLANTKVKEGRKIYITLNAQAPPMVQMPGLIQQSLKNAQLELLNLGLALGEITYKPDFALNTILAQYVKGIPINKGNKIPKGTKIDFEVGDGLGNQTFQMLNLVSLDLEEAIFVMRGYGLKLGNVFYVKEDRSKVNIDQNRNATINALPNQIFKHEPSKGVKTNIGQSVDLWIVDMDSTTQSDRNVPIE